MAPPSSNIKRKDDEHLGIGCFISLLMICILFVCMIGIITLVCVLAIYPVFPEFEITSASVSNTNSTAAWDVKFLVHNPNQALLIYKDFKGSLYYKDSPLTDIIIPNFSQDKKKQTTVNAMFPDTKDSSHASPVVEEVEEAIHGGMLNLNLWMWGSFGIKTPSESRWISSRIVCDNLKFQFSANTSGTLLGGSYHCLVEKFQI